VRIWDEDEETLTFMTNTSLLTHRFMKLNIGASEAELIEETDSESSEEEEQLGETMKKTDADLRMTARSKKSGGKKKKMNKEEMRAALEKKDEGNTKWQKFSLTRQEKMNQLEPKLK
jgi:hypothetical protein